MTQRKKKKTNWIDGLLNSQGQWCTGVDQLKDIGENHFKELFTSSTPSRLDEALLVVEKVISPDMSNKLTQPFSATKIQQAICQMHLSKASGPDGMSYLLKKKYWHILGNDVIEAMLFFFVLRSYFEKK